MSTTQHCNVCHKADDFKGIFCCVFGLPSKPNRKPNFPLRKITRSSCKIKQKQLVTFFRRRTTTEPLTVIAAKTGNSVVFALPRCAPPGGSDRGAASAAPKGSQRGPLWPKVGQTAPTPAPVARPYTGTCIALLMTMLSPLK